MAEFNKDQIGYFLGTVRKYMQMRGNLSQKDLAELTEIGVSTVSRFLNQKTKDLDPHVIARIVAKLEIPLHEIIEFVAEEFEDRFKKLVQIYRDDQGSFTEGAKSESGEPFKRRESDNEDLDDALGGTLGTAKQKAEATVKVGGRRTKIPFNPDTASRNSQMSLKDKLEHLTPRQKAYLTDFLSLDLESKDLVVDLGNSLFRYFRQKGMDF